METTTPLGSSRPRRSGCHTPSSASMAGPRVGPRSNCPLASGMSEWNMWNPWKVTFKKDRTLGIGETQIKIRLLKIMIRF